MADDKVYRSHSQNKTHEQRLLSQKAYIKLKKNIKLIMKEQERQLNYEKMVKFFNKHKIQSDTDHNNNNDYNDDTLPDSSMIKL